MGTSQAMKRCRASSDQALRKATTGPAAAPESVAFDPVAAMAARSTEVGRPGELEAVQSQLTEPMKNIAMGKRQLATSEPHPTPKKIAGSSA